MRYWCLGSWRCGFILLFLGVLFSTTGLSSLEFSEVMYNPQGSDTNREWIEVYNSGEENINLSNIFLLENNLNRNLALYSGKMVIESGEFAILSKNPLFFGIDYPYFSSNLFNCSFASLVNTDGEEISLLDKNNGFVYDKVYYNVNVGGNDNNLTLCKINSTWYECLPTPGEDNVIYSMSSNLTNTTNQTNLTATKNIKLSFNLPDVLLTGQLYENLFKITIEYKDNCSVKDVVVINSNYSILNYFSAINISKEVGCSSYSDTTSLKFNTSGDYLLCAYAYSNFTESNYYDNNICINVTVMDISSVDCDINLSLNLSHYEETNLYNQTESLKIYLKLNNDTFPYQITYWIEDLFGNVIKDKYTTTNTNQKSWTIDVEEEDRVLVAKAQLYPSCKDSNLDNNYAEKRFIVVNNHFWEEQTDSGDSSSKQNDSKIVISDLSSEAKFGELIKVDVEVYKGNTAKYSLSAWVEKNGDIISEKTKINLKSKYTNYEFGLPILLDANCNGKVSDGKATLIVEGLDEHEEKSITLSGKNTALCGSSSSNSGSSSSSSATSSSSKFSYEVSKLSSVTSLGNIVLVSVHLQGDKSEHKVRIWSYLYRGSKCYSCGEGEHENNEQEIELSAGENKEIVLEMVPDAGLEEGEYSIKIKINKDDQKTDYELTEKILLVKEGSYASKDSSTQSVSALSGGSKDEYVESASAKRIHLNSSGYVVYESSNEKAKKIAPWVLAVALGLTCLVLIWKPFS